jgi:hypothetical protein
MKELCHCISLACHHPTVEHQAVFDLCGSGLAKYVPGPQPVRLFCFDGDWFRCCDYVVVA